MSRYAGTNRFRVTASGVSPEIRIRAVLKKGNRVVASSADVAVGVWARGLLPSAPHHAAVNGRPGDWISAGRDQLRFGPTLTGDVAWKVVRADLLVEKPAPGWSVVLGTVSYKTPAAGIGHLWPSLSVTYRGSDGKEYREYDELSAGGTCPYSLALSHKTGDPEYDLIPAESGRYSEFYPCAVVPDAAIKGGVWQVRSPTAGPRPHVQFVEATEAPDYAFPKGLTPLNPYVSDGINGDGDWFDIPFHSGKFRMRFGPTLDGMG